MNIVEVYRRFPTEDDCVGYLEHVRWKGTPICPYCKSKRVTPMPKEKRHHCNNCNTTFSVTVSTIFHKTRLPLQKWFLAISLVLNARKGISARQLGRDIEVNKDTAWSMGMRIRKAMLDQRELLLGIVEMDETYIGGKRRNKRGNRGSGGAGRSGGGSAGFRLSPFADKTPVVGMVERDGNVKAKVVKNVKAKTMQTLVRENINRDASLLITDESLVYKRISRIIPHASINHQVCYVDGFRHTNTIEGFWALLKRGIVGQYHKVSIRYLPRYIDEFCYRYNNRRNLSLFDETIQRAVGV